MAILTIPLVIQSPLAAASLGACIIEKHISLDFNIKNAQDWKVSLNGNELKDFVKAVKDINLSMGTELRINLAKMSKNQKMGTKVLF